MSTTITNDFSQAVFLTGFALYDSLCSSGLLKGFQHPPEGRLEPDVGAALFLCEALGSNLSCEERWDLLHRPCEHHTCTSSSTTRTSMFAYAGAGRHGQLDPEVQLGAAISRISQVQFCHLIMPSHSFWHRSHTSQSLSMLFLPDDVLPHIPEIIPSSIYIFVGSIIHRGL